MIVRPPKTKEEFERYYDLRWRMLRAPWNQPRGSEKDPIEDIAYPIMVCEVDGIPIGVGRVHFNSDDEAQIRSMAVEPEWQKKGIGSIIINELEKIAIDKGAKYVVLNARDTAIPFYEKHGYRLIEKTITLFGTIPHHIMRKDF
ncbi:MAG: GNAT family N-acetyltransferase [Ignavibacteriales bacterium]|nr:MAG: GNAT family N-acetyltransferase [Ignavibacteriales bacterium]